MKSHRQITILLMIFLLMLNTSLFSQTKDTLDNGEDEKIYIHVKQMPEFPGGLTALRRWIGTHLNYPAVSRENGIQGTVYIRFEVKKDGTIGKVQIQKGVDPNFDKEVVKTIKSLPKFKPGEQNGKKVNVWFSVPITH